MQSSWSIWRESLGFFRRRFSELLPFLPLFFLPVFVDGFVSILVSRDKHDRELDPFSAIPVAFKAIGPLFRLKLRFYHLAFWWSLVPIFGWYKSFRIHEWWAQASNVVILEGLTGQRAFARCKDLVQLSSLDRNSQVFSIFPSLFAATCLVLMAIGVQFTDEPAIAVIAFAALLALEFPIMSAVNTTYYLSLPAEVVRDTLRELSANRKPSDFCPSCQFFEAETGICTRHHFNVDRYPQQFSDHCNGRSYAQRSAA